MALCRSEYAQNLCDPETRVPALESYCTEREPCLVDTPISARVKSTANLAALVAEIVTRFVNGLDSNWGAIALVCLTMILVSKYGLKVMVM